MITRKFKDVLSAWHGLVGELSFPDKSKWEFSKGDLLSWGVCVAYPDLLETRIEDATIDDNLHLEMSSYTKSRWTRFLRRYLRPDYQDWIHKSIKTLLHYKGRGFVSSYSINLNPESRQIGVGAHGGHKYGGCLSSIQIRINPRPRVILFSRACQLDKIGFLDLALIHLTAKEVLEELHNSRNNPTIAATWVISCPFISAISQVFYTQRFKVSLKGHILERRIRANLGRTTEDTNYGPLKRLLKRNHQMKTLGGIPGSCPVKDLSLEFKEVE